MTYRTKGQGKDLPHLRLTPQDVLELWQAGHYTPKGYLYHLVLAHRKPGWPWRIENIAQFCRDWEIPRSTFYRAKGALVAEGKLNEAIFGMIELMIPDSTNECLASETPVSNLGLDVSNPGLSVSDLGLGVSDLRHSQLKTLDIEDVCISTSFKQLITTTTEVKPSVCVTVKKIPSGCTTTRTSLQSQPDSEVKTQNTQSQSEEDKITPLILQRAEKIGVNLCDRNLTRVMNLWPERVPTALAALEEKLPAVKHPTRFLQRAIEDNWQPEETRTSPLGFREWFDEAKCRGLVIASERRQDGTLGILTRDERWLPFEQLRQMSWDELYASSRPRDVDLSA